ncbi:ATP-dependent RNA helicase DDX51 [Amphibalanus amphitrite]|uniref:ATP-dependent RNA helicase DDX51 n=1 Tax=Amphibalanus amphitrite TaxID=1232801 RepID=A0A6A4V1R3_AMPAM|nr:ATP-dependent RNA helicase DDX51 [Amphibalanus amphitrite]
MHSSAQHGHYRCCEKTLLGAAIWTELAALAGPSRRIHLQWVPSHCGVDGNERADQIAKEAAALPQAAVPVDVATAHRAAVRMARDRTTAVWPEGWYRTLMGHRLPLPPIGDRRPAPANLPALCPELRARLAAEGIEQVFLVQVTVLPELLAAAESPLPPDDLCVSAPAGRGKTLAFVLCRAAE